MHQGFDIIDFDENSGKKTENGKNMFIYQAMKAFQTWHGIKPEINEEVRDLII